MTYLDKWLVGCGVIGGAAGCVAIVVLWIILTRPLALLQAVVP